MPWLSFQCYHDDSTVIGTDSEWIRVSSDRDSLGALARARSVCVVVRTNRTRTNVRTNRTRTNVRRTLNPMHSMLTALAGPGCHYR